MFTKDDVIYFIELFCKAYKIPRNILINDNGESNGGVNDEKFNKFIEKLNPK
jgi:hypothetical protein